jgi:hypothetical protein
MRIFRTLSMALAALALLAAVPAAEARGPAKPPAKNGTGKPTKAKKRQAGGKRKKAVKKKVVKKKAVKKTKKKAPKKPVEKVFNVSADGSYYRTGTDDRDRYNISVDWLASGTVTVQRTRKGFFMGGGKLKGAILGYAGDIDERWTRQSADGTQVGCRMKFEDRSDDSVPWTIDGALQGSDPANAVPYLASGIGKIKRKGEAITTPATGGYDYDCGYFDRGDYPYVLYQRQLAAFPDDAHGTCNSLGDWKGGWSNECAMQLTTGDETEYWNFTLSITP